MKTAPKNSNNLKAEFARTYKHFVAVLKKEIRETKGYYDDYSKKLHIQKLEKQLLKKFISLLNRMNKNGLEKDELVNKAHRALAVMTITLNMQKKIANEKKKAHNKASKIYKKSKKSLEALSKEIYEKEKAKLQFT